MTEQLESIKTKLRELKRLDKGFTLFGSPRHQYRLNPTLAFVGMQPGNVHGVPTNVIFLQIVVGRPRTKALRYTNNS